ncbi:hypothetical protein D3C77_241470 [compost metagenome]
MQPTEQHGADGRRDVHHQDQQQRVLGTEAHDLIGIDGSKGDHCRDTGLVADGAGKKAQQVTIAPGFAQGLREARQHRLRNRRVAVRRLRLAALAQVQEGRQAGDEEQDRGDQHAHRHELCRSLALRLGPADEGQAGAQADQPADIAESPAPAGHLAQGIRTGEFGQEGGDQVLAAAEAEVR